MGAPPGKTRADCSQYGSGLPTAFRMLCQSLTLRFAEKIVFFGLRLERSK